MLSDYQFAFETNTLDLEVTYGAYYFTNRMLALQPLLPTPLSRAQSLKKLRGRGAMRLGR